MFCRPRQKKKSLAGPRCREGNREDEVSEQRDLGPNPWVRKKTTTHRGISEPALSLFQIPAENKRTFLLAHFRFFFAWPPIWNKSAPLKHDSAIGIPIRTSPALASYANTGKILSNSQCPRSFPLALSKWPQVIPQGFKYIYSAYGGPKSIHNATSWAKQWWNIQYNTLTHLLRKPTLYIQREISPCSELRLQRVWYRMQILITIWQKYH